MSGEGSERERLQQLSASLREATFEAMQGRSALARSLDELRGELDRLLMIGKHDPGEMRRVVSRARMMMDAWRGIAAASAARYR